MSAQAVKPNGVQASTAPGLWVVGLGSQYPPYTLEPEDLDKFASSFFDTQAPGLKKLLKINKLTGIQIRSAVRTYEYGFGTQKEPPTIVELDELFRQVGVDMAVQACRKALLQWGGDFSDITHTIGVTCTNQGNPGYDLLVNQALGLGASVDRMLLHGVGCAGGLAIMRAAAQIAAGATTRGRPARILAFACELCTPNVRCELASAERSNPEDVSIAGALFSDAAAAFILCNDIGLGEDTKPLLRLLEWENTTLQNTAANMTSYADPYGFRTVLAKAVPGLMKQAVKPMFDNIVPDYSAYFGNSLMSTADFDWALHPGGKAIMDGVKEMMDLNEHQLRASREIYRTKGNSSSPTVLIVLDKLLSMGTGSDHIVATSFGPGLSIEMALLKRCRESK